MRRTWLEDGGDTNGRADTLRQQDLVVLGAQAGHHDTEDVENAADEDEPPRTVLVVESSNDGPHAHHEEDLQRRDPRDRAGVIVAEQVILVVLLEDTDAWRKGQRWGF